jgi:hypothetical protein
VAGEPAVERPAMPERDQREREQHRKRQRVWLAPYRCFDAMSDCCTLPATSETRSLACGSSALPAGTRLPTILCPAGNRPWP